MKNKKCHLARKCMKITRANFHPQQSSLCQVMTLSSLKEKTALLDYHQLLPWSKNVRKWPKTHFFTYSLLCMKIWDIVLLNKSSQTAR